jgi:hypothetical protein
VEDGALSKAKLAQELFAALRVDRTARPAPGASHGLQDARARMSSQELEMTETVAQGHQKRGNKRFTYPVLRVLIGAQTYNTIDWSIGGLMVGDYMGDVKQNSRFKLTMSDGSKNATYFGAEGRAARVDKKKRTLSIQFTTLSKGGFEWLSGLQLMQRKKGTPPGRR